MKCEICGKDILKDSQCINYKYYHNDCIENLQQENKQLKEVIEKAIEKLEEVKERRIMLLDEEKVLEILKGVE